MTARKTLLIAALAAPLFGCGDLLYAEVEQPEVCKTLPDQLFAGSQTSLSLAVDLKKELPGVNWEDPNGLEGSFHLLRVDFIAKHGIENFDFVDSAKVTVLAPEGRPELPPVDVIDYTREGSTGATLSMTGANSIDLYRYLTGGVVRTESHLSGTLPPDEWSMDMRVCMGAKVRVDYPEVLGWEK